MTSRSRLACILGLALAASGAALVDDAPLRFRHASLVAYPRAVVSLKHPTNGMTFYVESDGRRLVALDDRGGLAWGLDVLAEAGVELRAGEPVIRHLQLDGDVLLVTCGKSDAVRVAIATGEARYAGRD